MIMEDKTNWAEILLIVVLITLWGPFNDQGFWDKLDFGLCIEFSTDNLINIYLHNVPMCQYPRHF